jgi:GNAT superfamily N-acetyltransferase
MVMRPLTAGDFDAVYEAFTTAFGDYVVPLPLTREQLEAMVTRRGWVPAASVGVFEDERMVAFTLNGVDGDRGYDTGTGVIPSHRGRGFSRDMLAFSSDRLREHGCTTYILEVIDRNTKAFEIYRREGFEVVRGLQCWRFEAHRLIGSKAHSGFAASRDNWDVAPSWQNSTQSIARARDVHVTLGDERGSVIVFPNTGDVPQLVVRRDSRRQGIGTQLLEGAAELAGKPLRIQNVDERDAGITAFLESIGAVRTVRQWEMTKAL